MFGLVLILGGLILASASNLGVSGGTLQSFRYEVDITVPTTTIPSETVTSEVSVGR